MHHPGNIPCHRKRSTIRKTQLSLNYLSPRWQFLWWKRRSSLKNFATQHSPMAAREWDRPRPNMAPPSPNCTVQCHTNQPQPLQCNHLTKKMNIAIISTSAPNSLKIHFTNFEVVQKLNPTFRSQSFTLPLTIATNTQIQTSFSATCLKNTTTKCTLVPKSSSWTNPFGDGIPSNLSQGEQDTFKTRQIPCLYALNDNCTYENFNPKVAQFTIRAWYCMHIH